MQYYNLSYLAIPHTDLLSPFLNGFIRFIINKGIPLIDTNTIGLNQAASLSCIIHRLKYRSILTGIIIEYVGKLTLLLDMKTYG